MRSFMAMLALALLTSVTAVQAEDQEVGKALSYKMEDIDGKPVDLSKYKGKVVLVVNVASKCGLTPQYKDLQAMYEKYEDKGFVILGFPCNQFGGQEPGSESEIKSFCTEKYGVTFPMFSKIDVNGDKKADLYKYLTSLDLNPAGSGDISWNFEKFLIDREGNVVHRFSPRTKPTDSELIEAIKVELVK